MIWGAPGIGKSSIVRGVAEHEGLELIDLRIAQLAPTDLRGIPVAQDGQARWYPPEFLPRSGRGILFLDELNLAPPTMQGIAQQLVLDRRVGTYVVPEGWFIWAAGNRREDRAATYEMPAPLANRFIHLEAEASLEAFRHWGFVNGVDERVLAFLSWRPELLHRPDPDSEAWPSPRTWEIASRLLRAELDITPAVGRAAAHEFIAWSRIYGEIPSLEGILAGEGAASWPATISVQYATTIGLAARAASADEAVRAFEWLTHHAGEEWLQLYVSSVVAHLQRVGQLGALAAQLRTLPRFASLLKDVRGAIAEGGT